MGHYKPFPPQPGVEEAASGYSGDGGPATSPQVNFPGGVITTLTRLRLRPTKHAAVSLLMDEAALSV